MTNPFENQMPNLSAMYGSWNPMSYLKGMQMEGDAAAFNQELAKQNQQKTQENQQAISLAELMNPQKVRRETLGNDTLEAQLPGVKANSDLARTNADMAKDSYATKLDDLIKGHQFKDKERELKQLEMGGQAYMQAEPMLASIPPPARHAAAKRLLGPFYQPEFDQVPPEKLGQVLNFVGSEMMQSQQKLYQASQIADKKGDIALQINDKKAETAKALAEYKSTLATKLAGAKSSGDPKTYQAAATKLLEAARQESDPERRQELLEQAQQFASLNIQAMAARPQATAEGKPDLGKLGIETNPPVQMPTLSVPGATAGPPVPQNNPATKDPNMAKLPAGTKALGNGIYQLPDGRKVKAN